MPLVQGHGRKRRAEQASLNASPSPFASPEPATQRRRTTQHQHQHRSDDEDAYGNDNGATQAGNQEQMVKKLVRLALACEYRRVPIRRNVISEQVLGSAGRQFKAVFAQAQLQLRSVFGMEMVELPVREKVTIAQKRAAKSQSQSSKTASSYILISILPSAFHDPEILPPPAIPTPSSEAQYISIYTLLISLIRLSGGQLPDTKLNRHLRRLQMEDNTPVAGYNKTEHLLKRMEREGYILKIKENTGGEEDVYWTVGPRGKVEVGDDGVKGLTKAVYGDMEEGEEAELERRIERSLGVGDEVVSKRQEESKPKGNRGRKKKGAEEDRDDEEEEEEEDDDDE